MGTTKAEIFSDEQNKLATAFKVFGHPARIAIIQHLIEQKTCICTDLVDELGLAQATISQHLVELKKIGILQGSIAGKSICYCIDESVWNTVKQAITAFFDQDVSVTSCC